jgi:cell division protein FtsW (lipid II flippase)
MIASPVHERTRLQTLMLCCAPLPALALGVIAMRDAGLASSIWLMNVGAVVVGLIALVVIRCVPAPTMRRTQLALAATAFALIISTFIARGSDGVHRWLSLGGIRIQASSIAAPLLIVCVAAMVRTSSRGAIAIAAFATAILALQPDAAVAVSVAAACSVVMLYGSGRRGLPAAILLVALAVAAFARRDPLAPVAHVEGILALSAAGSATRTLLGIVSLALLPVPFVAEFYRHRYAVSLALGVYIASITIAPLWGTFPVPIMGYGVSPIVGYFTVLAFCPRHGADSTRGHHSFICHSSRCPRTKS